jgi:proprotein convertase subtilisin/kexin type 5
MISILGITFLALSWLNIVAQTNKTCPFSNCAKCSENLETCDECISNFIFSREENRCYYMGTCAPGEYKSSSSGNCEQCESSCRTCTGAREFDCNTCLEGYFPYFLYVSGYIKKCLTCHTVNCKECEGPQNCIKCQEGYWLNQSDGLCKKLYIKLRQIYFV